MKAVIMAGGEGTRLRPLTSLLPKPMVPIVNQPVMEHILGLVKHHGVTEVVATLAFMPGVIQDYFGAGEEWGMQIAYAIEETPLGTAGSVKNAQGLLEGEEPILIVSGDALTDIDLAEVVRFHREKGGAVTIALKRVDDPLEFGVVVTDDDGRIDRFLEKPTWGQVFSDTINTGIYVIEPWVLDYIPEGTPYDFSSELFPALMKDGHALYGAVVDGYWCDVGSRESYMDVHRDVLDGRAMVFKPGFHARDGLWVGEGAEIHPTAVLGDKVVIGKNVHVREGAVIGDYTVIGDNSVVAVGAHIGHSIVWSDAFVGRTSTVEGAVLCRRVDVRISARIDNGAAIGDETMIGRGAHVGAGVQVFPYKRIEPGAVVNSSLIWEAVGIRALFGSDGISGIIGIDITPELALKVAQSFGTLLPRGSHVAVSRDTSLASRMIKRAVIAGLNSSGINVRDLRVATPSLTRFTTQKTRCTGGIHIAVPQDDPQSLRMQFFDSNGMDIPPYQEKKVERLYFREEFRRAFFNELGDIIYPPRPLEYYTAALDEAIEERGLSGPWRNVIVDFGGGAASITLPLIAPAWHLNLVAINVVVNSEAAALASEPSDATWDEIKGSIDLFGADLGARFDAAAERLHLITRSGEVLDGDRTLAAMVDLWCRTDTSGQAIAVPLQASSTLDHVGSCHGREVIRPGRTRRALSEAVLRGQAGMAGSTRGGFVFAGFTPSYDAVLSLGMLVRMLAAHGTTLDEVVAAVPRAHKASLEAPCPSNRKGAVMRAVAEASQGHETDLTEGVRVTYDDGWALVLPDSSEAFVHIVAEAADDDAAAQRAAHWAALVAEAVADTRS